MKPIGYISPCFDSDGTIVFESYEDYHLTSRPVEWTPVYADLNDLKSTLWEQFMDKVAEDDHLPGGERPGNFLGSVARYKKLFLKR